MKRLSMATRDELVAAVGRDTKADRHERGRILDEITFLAGFHRKHAARLIGVGDAQSARCTAGAPYLHRSNARGAGGDLGGIGPGLRQAAASADADAGRNNGAAWPYPARRRMPRPRVRDERGDD